MIMNPFSVKFGVKEVTVLKTKTIKIALEIAYTIKGIKRRKEIERNGVHTPKHFPMFFFYNNESVTPRFSRRVITKDNSGIINFFI